MKLINVVYDGNYNDCDLVLAQDAFCNDILKNEAFFLYEWVTDPSNDCYKVLDGVELLCVGTDDLLRYLNAVFGDTENERAVLVKRYTDYDPELPIFMM